MAGDIVVYVIMIGTVIALVAGWWYGRKHAPQEFEQREAARTQAEKAAPNPPELA